MSTDTELRPDEVELLEVSTALYGWGTQDEAFEAVRKCVERIVAARAERAEAEVERLRAEGAPTLTDAITALCEREMFAAADVVREIANGGEA